MQQEPQIGSDADRTQPRTGGDTAYLSSSSGSSTDPAHASISDAPTKPPETMSAQDRKAAAAARAATYAAALAKMPPALRRATRIKSYVIALVIFLPAIVTFGFDCLSVYTPTLLTHLAIGAHPLAGPIANLLVQPPYLAPDGQWMPRLAAENANAYAGYFNQDAGALDQMTRYETDDLVIALGLIMPVLQMSFLAAIGAISRPLTEASRPYFVDLPKWPDATHLDKATAFSVGLAALFVFLIFRAGMLLPSAEVDRYQNARDFGDFLLQTIRPLFGYDLFTLLSCALLLAASRKNREKPAATG